MCVERYFYAVLSVLWARKVFYMDLNEVQLDEFLFDIQAFADGGENGSEDTGAESTATDTDTTDEPANEETEPFKVFKTQSELDSFLDKKFKKLFKLTMKKPKEKLSVREIITL